MAHSREPVLEFLRAAQDQGYGEAAIDYLGQQSAAGKPPAELADTLDLELSRSYRVAVGEAFNAAEAESRLASAQGHLDKFLKEHPDHPAVARAIESWGDIVLDRALQRMRLATVAASAEDKSKGLVVSRTDFEEAKKRYADATARYLAEFSKLSEAAGEKGKRPKTTTQPTRKQRLAEEALRGAEIAWRNCQLKEAKVEFHLAQTYADPQDPARKSALETAIKNLDPIFQANRESLIGLEAHLWHGRAADELGNDQLALDIYDEVLASSPEGRERETGLEPLFAQVQYQQLLVVLRKNGPREFLLQANAWRDSHKTWNKLDGYQGVTLETAKVTLAQASELSGEKKSLAIQAGLAMLAQVAKVRGEFQSQAILLRRQHAEQQTTDLATVKTFAEAFAIGQSAAERLDWPTAVAALARALELRSTTKDAQRIAAVEQRFDAARYQLAAAQFASGKLEDCWTLAQAIRTDRPDGPLAPAASSLAISTALSLYVQATDKPAALARLTELAKATIERWPNKPEADDARIALGQAELVRGNLPAAVSVFEAVDRRSLRHPAAMFLAGQTNWRLYLARKNNSPAEDEQVLALRGRAQEQLRASLEAQHKAAQPGTFARPLVEAQLLLGELRLEASDGAEAAALVNPLVEWLRAEKPQQLDNVLLRAFLAGARANAAAGQLDQATAAANLLLELGPDDAAVNGVLGSMLRSFHDAWRQAEAESIEARTSSDAARGATAEATAARYKEFLQGFVPKLASRQHIALPALIYLGECGAQLGQTDAAREVYQTVLARAEQDPQFKQANVAALTRVQAQLVGLLRQKGQFEEGLKQVDKLIEAFPNALEPKMEKGRLLQGWAEVDSSHLGAAVAHWTSLRLRLAKLAKKPPEYYEVVYNAASCLLSENRTERNPQKALQAEQLLNATLVLAPRLSGPEMVARYKQLLQQARGQQGRPG